MFGHAYNYAPNVEETCGLRISKLYWVVNARSQMSL